LYADPSVDLEGRETAEKILSAVGKTLWIEDESLMDAVTAVSGSGPAYVFYFIEALQSAGASLGLSTAQQLRYVIVPQSIRIAIPPTVGFLVQLIKNTSLAATIGLVELTREGQLTAAGTYMPFAVFTTVACIYFAMCFPLTQWSRSLERKLDVAR
jgi:hypothetical protein